MGFKRIVTHREQEEGKIVKQIQEEAKLAMVPRTGKH